jgi:hypothetical protein
LAAQGIEELRFWNRQWRTHHEGVLLEIWNVLHRRTGCASLMRKVQNHRYVPPPAGQLMQRPPLPGPLLPQRVERGKMSRWDSLCPSVRHKLAENEN